MPAGMLSRNELDALGMLGHFFLQHGLHEKAATVFAALEQLDPERLPAQTRALAVARDRMGQPAKALEALDRLAISGEIDEQFHVLRAKVLGDLERWSEARLAMQAAIECRDNARTPAGGSERP